MSSLAQILFDAGEQVQGSDVDKYFFTEQPLRERNIPILHLMQIILKKV